MQYSSRIWAIQIIMALVLTLNACTTTEAVREIMDPKNLLSSKTKLDLKIIVDADVNPDQNGRPSPVVARLYSLASPSIFENADFVSLYHNDKQILGADFIRKEEKDFRPSEQFHAQIEFNDQANFIGFMVAFQDIEQARWRMVLPLDRKQHNYMTIRLSKNNIILEQE